MMSSECWLLYVFELILAATNRGDGCFHCCCYCNGIIGRYLEYMQPFPWGNPPFLAFCGGIPVGVLVWLITSEQVRYAWTSFVQRGSILTYVAAVQMPTWLRNIYVIPSFISAVLWFDIYAVELVECLRTFGYILDIPISLLGVTILAWGNSIGDFFADRCATWF